MFSRVFAWVSVWVSVRVLAPHGAGRPSWAVCDRVPHTTDRPGAPPRDSAPESPRLDLCRCCLVQRHVKGDVVIHRLLAPRLLDAARQATPFHESQARVDLFGVRAAPAANFEDGDAHREGVVAQRRDEAARDAPPLVVRVHHNIVQLGAVGVQAFQDAGAAFSSIRDILDLGVYLTTAVKCGKTGYGIKAATIKECSLILEQELAFLPNLKAIMLMGNVAIKAINTIARRAGEGRVIPAGSTYKIRGASYAFRGIPTFPSYLQAGPSFFIEKSKRRMIAEDIAAALRLL